MKFLYFFIEIVKNNNSLTKAAKKLYISQPALSKRLIDFENKHNIKLFVRENGRLNKLTQEGEVFYNGVKTILSDYEMLLDEVKSTKSEVIKIGIPNFIISDIIYPFLPKLTLISHENCKISFIEGSSIDIFNQYNNNEIDCMFMLSSIKDFFDFSGDEHQLYSSEVDVFMLKNHPLSHLDIISWKDFNDEKIIFPTKQSVMYYMCMQKLKMVNPAYMYNIESVDPMLSYLNEGFCALLPRITKTRRDDVIRKRMDSPIPWNVSFFSNHLLAHNEITRKALSSLISVLTTDSVNEECHTISTGSMTYSSEHVE